MMHTKLRSLALGFWLSAKGVTSHMRISFFLALSLTIVAADAQSVDEASLGESVERHLSPDEKIQQWTHDPGLLNREVGDMIVATQVTKEEVETVKLQNVIPPIRFESGVADIPQSYVESLRKVLDGMRDRKNVRLHLVGHADDQALSAALAQRYGP